MSDHMKILVLVHEYPPVGGGGGRVAQDIAERLVKKGHEIHVVTSHIKGLPTTEVNKNVYIHRVKCARKHAYKAHLLDMALYILISSIYSLRLIRKMRPTIIHTHFAVPAGFAALLVSVFSGIPFVITSHLGDVPGGVPEKTGKIFPIIYPLTKIIWKKAEKIIAVSQFTKVLILSSYPFVDPIVVHNGVDIEAIKPLKIDVNDPPNIVFAGRLVPQKNPIQIIRTLGEIKELTWNCTIIGDGPLRKELEQKIVALGIEDKVHITGWLKPDEVLSIYDKSDILFMTSLEEGLPIAGVQALAKGLAVVLSDVGGCNELVKKGVNGFLVSPSEPEKFVGALENLLKDHVKLLSCKRASLKLALDFDIKHIISSYEKIFLSLSHHSR